MIRMYRIDNGYHQHGIVDSDVEQPSFDKFNSPLWVSSAAATLADDCLTLLKPNLKACCKAFGVGTMGTNFPPQKGKSIVKSVGFDQHQRQPKQPTRLQWINDNTLSMLQLPLPKLGALFLLTGRLFQLLVRICKSLLLINPERQKRCFQRVDPSTKGISFALIEVIIFSKFDWSWLASKPWKMIKQIVN
ncbi:hypothetical protein T07_1258 [Trichinella nelsoni]|uniref:Uncharacterized protein n=1 Tax=Trichinella nelsoni TaxID=6336 RepID=A0A0V0RUD5_9BILA|nr:hypothetical protein T07_1258 [Trichinella nelsoni]